MNSPRCAQIPQIDLPNCPKVPQSISNCSKIIPAKHPNNCLYAFEVADWLPLARAYLSLQTGCLLLVRLNISVSVFVSVYVSVYVSAYDLYL